MKSTTRASAVNEALKYTISRVGRVVDSAFVVDPDGSRRSIKAVINNRLQGKGLLFPSNSGTRRNPTGKTPAVSITLTRTQGGNHDLNEPHTVEGGDVWNKANVLISLWGREAKEGEKNKTKFHIRYADGETYSGTYYVSRADQVTGSLGKHMEGILKSAAGKKRPAGMTTAQYKEKLAKLGATKRKAYADFLTRYEIGCSKCACRKR